jgi:hypothetical protein
MNLEAMGKALILCALTLLVVGGAMWLLGRTGLPKLPGDLVLEGKNWKLFFPIVTSIVLSIALTVVLNLVARFWR